MEVLKVESSGARIEKVQPIQFWLSVCFVSWDNARLTFYLCEKFCRKTLHLILPIQKCTSSFIVLPFSSANAFINVNFIRLKSKHLHVPFSTLVSSSRQAIDFRLESGGLFSNMFWRDRFCNIWFVRVRGKYDQSVEILQMLAAPPMGGILNMISVWIYKHCPA